MSEIVPEPSKANAIALINARLEAVLQETRKGEAKLKRMLEMKRLRRRLRAAEAERK